MARDGQGGIGKSFFLDVPRYGGSDGGSRR